MKKTQRTVGQILFAVGVTLAIGGILSLFFDNVELRFISTIVTTDAGRVTWIIINILLLCFGLFLWRNSISSDNIA
ncbi:MAG: hypothetical protein KJ069_09535 [Anaerolineae bacterium]|nr:hypothetical protein [Anaerolineae bacterium]